MRPLSAYFLLDARGVVTKPSTAHAGRIVLVYCAVVGATLVWDIVWAQSGIPLAAASRENALEAIKLLKDWSTWLAGIETAAIAAVGALPKMAVPRSTNGSPQLASPHLHFR